MLVGNFFTISGKVITGQHIVFTININALHHIFDGHFPGQPVVPGVCMMQIFKELLEIVIEAKTRLIEAEHVKFLAVINPLINPTIQVDFTYDLRDGDTIAVSGKFFKDNIIFLKFKGSFLKQATLIGN